MCLHNRKKYMIMSKFVKICIDYYCVAKKKFLFERHVDKIENSFL